MCLMNEIARHQTTQKGDLQQCNNHYTLRPTLKSHSSTILLRFILNRLKPQPAEIIAEEQAGFMVGWSTIERIVRLRVICKKHFQR